MNTLQQLLDAAKSSVLLISAPGCGKTTTLTQLPRTYILELDNNLAGPANFLKANNLQTDCGFFIPHIKDGKAIAREDRYRAFTSKAAEILMGTDYDNLAVDSISALVNYLMDEIRRQQKKTIGSFDGRTVDTPFSLPDWGCFIEMFKELILRMKSFPKKRVIFTSHIEFRENETKEESKTLMSYVAIPTNLRLTVSGMFDEVWYLFQKEELVNGKMMQQRYIRTAPENFRQEALGLKSASGLQTLFKLDFSVVRNALGTPL